MPEDRKARERNVEAFDRDAREGGYQYTSERLSCRLSNRRLSDAVLALAEPQGKRIIDIGCGDGAYTVELATAGAREVLGLDASMEAIRVAAARAPALQKLSFDALDVYRLEAPATPYDVAVVRGLLHHLYDPSAAVARISRMARRIVVVEPNGWNPVLKLIEKLSRYHVEHEEKSYGPPRLDGWFRSAGCRVESRGFVGLVPFFCPDLLARVLKGLEPGVEATPLLRNVVCGQYVAVYSRAEAR